MLLEGVKATSSTSTTAPIRSSPRRTRSPEAPAPDPGVGPLHINRVIGIAKSDRTRVGYLTLPDLQLLDTMGFSSSRREVEVRDEHQGAAVAPAGSTR